MVKSDSIRRTATERLVLGTGEPGEETGDSGFTAAELCAAFKTAHAAFVSGKTNRKAIEAITKLLEGALSARRQMIQERDRLTTQWCERFFPN